MNQLSQEVELMVLGMFGEFLYMFRSVWHVVFIAILAFSASDPNPEIIREFQTLWVYE